MEGVERDPWNCDRVAGERLSLHIAYQKSATEPMYSSYLAHMLALVNYLSMGGEYLHL